ncbi:MAG: NAAT family transporter [Myxococcota bacterium]
MIGEMVSFSLVAFSAIFFIVDPFAVVPVFIAMTERDSDEKRRNMARRACLIAAGVLLFFAFGGSVVFKLLGVTLAAFKIAGGILLLLTSLDMLRSKTSETRATEKEIAEGAGKEDIAVVPLAMPLLSGPGSIATVTMLTAQSQRWWELIPIVVSILLTALISYFVLRAAPYVDRALGKSGQAIVARIMGLLLAAIAVQFVVSGVREAFPELFAQAH